MSFAWAGNALAILQTDELEKMADEHPDGVAGYIYTFQLAVLTLLTTLCLWGMVGLGVFDSFKYCEWPNMIIKFVIFFFASLSIRECWHVVLFTQLLLLARLAIKKNEKENRS